MIAMTTSSSIRVNPEEARHPFSDELRLRIGDCSPEAFTAWETQEFLARERLRSMTILRPGHPDGEFSCAPLPEQGVPDAGGVAANSRGATPGRIVVKGIDPGGVAA